MAQYNEHNFDLFDKYQIKDVVQHNGVIFSGNTKMIKGEDPKSKRISPLLAAAVLGVNNTSSPCESTSKHEIMWTDLDAQEMYLRATPTCYLILGKPSLGAFSLGEALSKKYNCIHLCPRNIITDEISQGSTTGKCLDFNLKHNIICSPNTILKMLFLKVKSPAVKHRGYVISGFPFVTSYKSPNTLLKTKHTEEALLCVDEILFDVIYNLKRKKNKRKKKLSETESTQSSANFEGEEIDEEEKEEEEVEEEGEEQEVVAELPKFILNKCAHIFKKQGKVRMDTQQSLLLHQLHDLFDLNLKPNVVIYITCPDSDILTVKNHKFTNYKNGQNIVEPFLDKVTTDLRWPTRYTLSDYENPHNIHVFNPKYNCRSPINFNNKAVDQICNYKDYVLPYIEKKFMDFDPKQVIKLDGRTSIHQMMHQLAERLLLMDINPVIIPEPLYIEEPPEDYDEFWQLVGDLRVIQSGVLKFKCYPSPWYNRCPVELKKRRSVLGKPKFAVKLFKHIYVMHSLDNFVSFCRNPRPYLKLKYLEPTCRIIVTGTKSSGKTMVAECLSWIFDTPVTSFDTLFENIKQEKYEMYAKSIFSEISARIEDARYMEWQVKEQNRQAGLNEWCNSVLVALKEYIPLLITHLEYLTMNKKPAGKEKGTLDSGTKTEEKTKGKKKAEEQNLKSSPPKKTQMPKPAVLNKIKLLRNRLSFLPISLNNVEECETILSNFVVNHFTLLQYAPLELTTKIKEPNLPVLGDDDVTKAITEYIALNDLQKEIDPSIEELMTQVTQLMSTVNIKSRKDSHINELYEKYIIDGLPADPEYWEILTNAKLLPDYTISIMENREIEPELLLQYMNIEKSIKNYYEKLGIVKDPLVLCKLQTKHLPKKQIMQRNVELIVRDLVHNSYNSTSLLDPDFTEENIDPNPELIASFTQSIEKFREDWDSVKIKLEDMSKCYIEVELEGKTDVEVLEEVLLKIRKGYFLKSEVNEGEEIEVDEEDNTSKNLLLYNNPQNLCETNIYCPYTYYNHQIFWEGKPEFSLNFNNKIHYFAKEEYIEMFQKDITKYQTYSKPFKKLPPLKICVTGGAGSGKTTMSKQIALELGLLHVNFETVINDFYIPRHYKKVGRVYENPFTDIPIEEESVFEFQLDEENPNLFADILSNEVELRRMLFNYFERGQPLISAYIQNVIRRIWFDYPYKNIGIVLDGYPRLTQDIEDMVQCSCIPDLVIDLNSNAETTIERLGPLMLKRWKSQLQNAKHAHRLKMENEKNEWMRLITKLVVVEVIIDEMLDSIPVELPEPINDNLSVASAIMDTHPTGSENLDPRLFNAYNKVIEEHPEPIDERDWDKPSDERERIESRLEAIFETESENIESLRELAEENNIKIFSVDSTKPFYKVYRKVLSKLSNLRKRSRSFLEQTYIITNDMAELLLSHGYYFLSKFGRMCPVYIFENSQTIFNSYKISKRKGKLFPVIHRAYIYFISKEDYVEKFRINPLKFIASDRILTYHPYPLRIGIIGTPKSGKSTLAAKLARQNNLLCISRGMALRRVLNQMHWTELARKILRQLHDGDILDSDLVMSAVQTVAIDHRTLTYGFVLDGFPSSPNEGMALAKDGLYPNVIFDVSSHKLVILEISQTEVYNDILKYKPPYSVSFMEHRFTKWNEQCYKIKNWINSDYQNMCLLNGNESKWQCLQDAKNKIKELIPKINYYLANVETNIVPAHAMAISNEIFEQKQSSFRNMCPACLAKNVFRHSNYPGDKTGVVQYKYKLYWICADHWKWVLMYPDYYLLKEINIPEIPAVVKIINTDTVYENGVCMVTYAENLPRQIIERGTNKFAATYKSKTYLFCSEPCLRKFLDKPHLFSDITVFKGSSWFPRLCLKKLPNLGYLEQTLSNILTEACCSVNAIRPKYPGLSFQLSGIIYIALYLKTHNPHLPKDKLNCYLKALKVFETRSNLILDLGLRMRSMENPFTTYPEVHQGTPKKYSNLGSVEARRVPVPDERFDYLCEFHKPASKVPAFLNVVDIAGLVRGAAEGQGLGNAFLSHIKACDAIFNLCRAFDDEDVIHVDGDVNPVRDLETIGEELRLKDEEQLMQNIEKLDRVVNRGNDKKLKPEYDSLQKIKTVLVDEKKHIRFGDWSAADIEILNKYLFLTSKPTLYLVNLSEKDYIRKKNKWLPKLKEWIDKNDPGAPLIPFSGAFETKLVEMDATERQAFLKENNLSSALDKIIVQGYKALQLEYFFTAGPDEVKAWTIQKGTKAPQAAGRIHTDFEKGFIMAEVMHFKDFKEEGTEVACKSAGKYRQQGRNYVVEDGDIIFFKFNAGAGLKDAKKK
ncbi:unnamed protein product [Arctia plantaginis]|uniref:Adenylate kinase 9 n=1 Tax=Arctia plantaginis TaxID=874455 RepID=A0A8S0ZRL9_ARCPL|nr:unnamed protein product [Arctia plantaginis]